MRFVLMFVIGMGVLVWGSQSRLPGSFDKTFESTAVSKAELQLRGGSGPGTWGYGGSNCLPLTTACANPAKPQDVLIPPAVVGAACANGPWCHDSTPNSECKTIYYIYFDYECVMTANYSCLAQPGIVVLRPGMGGGTYVCACDGAAIGGACGSVTACIN